MTEGKGSVGGAGVKWGGASVMRSAAGQHRLNILPLAPPMAAMTAQLRDEVQV